ncbi:hypothetical protein [Mycobacterium sp. 050134]|uniref:hypothetical protein n=1 Tax=Mycobacterium sp. 050134 TaxID=3096111 RepID=UPI002ED7A964
MTYDVHIRTVDGFVEYPNAFSYGVADGVLMVEAGEDADHSDKIFFSPNYWCQYVVDPNGDDPLNLDLDEFEDEDEE